MNLGITTEVFYSFIAFNYVQLEAEQFVEH